MNQIFVTVDPSVESYNATVVSQNNMDVYNNQTVQKCLAKISEYQQALHCLQTCMCCYSVKLCELRTEIVNCCG